MTAKNAKTASEGMGGNAHASRAWKGNGCRGSPRLWFFLPQALSNQHSAVSRQRLCACDL